LKVRQFWFFKNEWNLMDSLNIGQLWWSHLLCNTPLKRRQIQFFQNKRSLTKSTIGGGLGSFFTNWDLPVPWLSLGCFFVLTRLKADAVAASKCLIKAGAVTAAALTHQTVAPSACRILAGSVTVVVVVVVAAAAALT
jgi:hypothetical protein